MSEDRQGIVSWILKKRSLQANKEIEEAFEAMDSLPKKLNFSNFYNENLIQYNKTRLIASMAREIIIHNPEFSIESAFNLSTKFVEYERSYMDDNNHG